MSKPKIYDYYVYVYAPGHHRAVGEGYVPEHILVAEKTLKRYLTPDEDVRHKNGNTQDNRPSNLEITSLNSDFKVQSITGEYETRSKSTANRTFMPCKFQKPCWKEVRGPLAKKKGVYIPYVCSYQTEGDVPKCGIFWNYISKVVDEEKRNREREEE